MRKDMTTSTMMLPLPALPNITETAAPRDPGQGTQGRMDMSKTNAKAKTIRPRRAKDGIDLERVIWDPEYRAAIRERLNRPTTLRQLPRRKRS
jgi:hypothetical protein